MNNILALFNVGSNVMLSLGIIFVLVFIVFYIRQRLSDYDNKINSMFQLVSKMANEIRFLKTPLPTIHENKILPDYKTEELKVVSLDINESNDGDVDEDIVDSNNDFEHDEQYQENETEENEIEENEENEDMNDSEYDDEDNNENIVSDNDSNINNDDSSLQNNNENMTNNFVENDMAIETDNVRVVEFDKTLDENVEKINIPNYKKLKFDELKTLVSTKGLASEIQKLRKAELVSLLEEDFKNKQKTTTNEMELV